jgi:hypothetical protein
MARPRGTTAEWKFGRRPGVARGERNSATSAEYLQQKVRLVRAEVEKMQLTNARLRGELVPVDEVQARFDEIMWMLRDRVLLVETVLPLLHAVALKGGVKAMRPILRKELENALDLGPIWLVPPNGSAA